MKAVIIDDEILAIEELKRILDKNDVIKSTKGFSDAKEGLTYILLKEPEIAFIDINMPYIKGTYLAREIAERNLNTKVIFVTAYDNYALEAYNIDVFDYILKPISEKRISKSINKVLNYYQKVQEKDEIESSDKQRKKPKEQWALLNKGSLKIVATNQIRYFEVKEKRLKVNTIHGEYELAEKLSSVIEQLDSEQFFQCYKSIVVNVEYIDRISPMFNQTYEIVLKDDSKALPVSRHYGVKIKEKLDF